MSDISFQKHLEHVQKFLQEMYAVMIDPVEDATGTVADTCRLLLNAARRDRETINHLMTAPRDAVPGKPRTKRMENQNEQRYFDALKRITLYQSVERLRRHSERDWGVEYPESLEMAYENVISDAERAIRGKRRPKDGTPTTARPVLTNASPEATKRADRDTKED